MKEINVLGFGLMGKQIAGLLVLLGYKVNVWNHRTVDLSMIDVFVKKYTEIFGNQNGEVCFVPKLTSLPDVLTIESLVEDIKIKSDVFAVLKSKITKGYFTNTSSFSPSEIGAEVGVIHFFNPMQMKFVEFMPSKMEDCEANNLIKELKEKNFLVVSVKNNRCFLGNFILFHEFSIYFKLIESYNYPYSEVQKVSAKLYQDRDFLKIIDIVGVDVTVKIMENIKECDKNFYVPKVLIDALKQGVLGRKNNTSIKDYLLSFNM